MNQWLLDEPYKRGCQGKILLLPLREETDGGLHPARSPFGEVLRPVLQTDGSQSTVSLDGFMREGGWTPSVPEATQAKRGGLIRQPWSYLRLDAYSFLWLCEGA